MLSLSHTHTIKEKGEKKTEIESKKRKQRAGKKKGSIIKKNAY